MSTGNGTVYGWFVEARLKNPTFSTAPIVISGITITESWRRISYEKFSLEGVPNHVYPAIAQEQGILSYAAAKALMAWNGATFPSDSLEFRMVKVELRYNFTIEELGVSDPEDFGFVTGYGVKVSPREEPSEV